MRSTPYERSDTGRRLPDSASWPAGESVHCCVSSPPYWGLRSYKGDPGMIGLEPTFDEHLSNLVEVFREVRRVLRTDGTCWLNYGDAYVQHWAQSRWYGAASKSADLTSAHPTKRSKCG